MLYVSVIHRGENKLRYPLIYHDDMNITHEKQLESDDLRCIQYLLCFRGGSCGAHLVSAVFKRAVRGADKKHTVENAHNTSINIIQTKCAEFKPY